MCRSKRMKGWQSVRREGILIWRIRQRPLERRRSAERPELETWVWEQLGHRRPGSLDEDEAPRREAAEKSGAQSWGLRGGQTMRRKRSEEERAST